MEIKNAVIEDMDIGKRQFISKGSVLIAKIMLDTGNSSNCAITVQLPDDCVGQWLQKFFETVGIDALQQSNNKAVRLKIDETLKDQARIGHIIKDIWFNPYELREDSAA